MTHGTALWKGDTWNAGWGELSLAHDGALLLTTQVGTAETQLNLGASAFVDTYATDSWVAAVGASGHELAVGHREGPRLDLVGTIPRLDLSGRAGFDAHAVRFHPKEGQNQCVLAWEIGIALVDPSEGVVWSFVHDDVNQRVLAVTDHTAELAGVQRAFSIELADGSATVRVMHNDLDIDPEIMAEWRRSIGR